MTPPLTRRRLLLAAGVGALGLAGTGTVGVARVVPTGYTVRPDPGAAVELARLAGPDPTTIEEVLDRLAAVRDHAAASSPLGTRDGIACFSRLYHVITSTVRRTAAEGGFADAAFLTRLDVEFARRYLDALRAYAHDPAGTPRCWRILFDRRADPAVPPENFAAAGVNAHVNFDLAFALLATWEAVPPVATVHHHDYRRVNDIFDEEMDGLRRMFGGAPGSGAVAQLWNRMANGLGGATVAVTREAAWNEAVAMRGRDADALRTFENTLDVATALAGHGILTAPVLPI